MAAFRTVWTALVNLYEETLVLIGGNSLVTGRAYPSSVSQLIAALAKRQIHPYDELRAQVRRIFDAGIRPSHFDTHKHTHLAPPVLDAVARLAQEFGVKWVRRPFDFPMTAMGAPFLKRLTSNTLSLMRRHFHRVLSRHGCRTTDHFAGFHNLGLNRLRQMGLHDRVLFAEPFRQLEKGHDSMLVNLLFRSFQDL